MRFKHPAWIPVSWFLSLANLGAVWFAARPGEPWHATTHALLSVLFALGAQHLASRSRATVDGIAAPNEMDKRVAGPDAQQLSQALEAIAVEVERIGEGQRYLTKVLAERETRAPDAVPAPGARAPDDRGEVL